MATDKRLTHEQKLKLKALRKQGVLSRDPESLAYHGNKYRTSKLVPIFLATETGILEAFVASGRKLTDGDVEQSLVELIGDLRRRPAIEVIEPPGDEVISGKGDALVLMMIRLRWQEQRSAAGLAGRDDLIGVLRSTLGSIETWSAGPRSQSYLEYIEGFLGKMGVNVRRGKA